MFNILHTVWRWFANNEWLALWIEGFALVAIFWREMRDSRAQHKETLDQLKLLREQVEATKGSAQAAQKSADLAASLHLPYLGLLETTGNNSGQLWNMDFVIKNFGLLLAASVGFTVTYSVDGGQRREYAREGAVQIFPGGVLKVQDQYNSGSELQSLLTGSRKLVLNISIPYNSQDGRSFKYTAEVAYVAGIGFQIVSSRTIEELQVSI